MEQEIIGLLKNIQSAVEAGGKDWINTLAGGFLALLGAFGVQAIRLISEKKKEESKFLRNKLEQIGVLLIEFDEAIQKDFSMIVGLAAPDDANTVPPVHNKLQALKLNINLYHDDIADKVPSLERGCLEYFSIKRELVSERQKLGKLKDSTIQRLYSKMEECLNLKSTLLEEVVEASSFSKKK